MPPIRPAIVTPFLDFQDPYLIEIRHPGYEDDANIILKLHPSDKDKKGLRGLETTFALNVCAIVADVNMNDGYLSIAKDGNHEVEATSFLRQRRYYYHVRGSGELPYPIVPNFQEWKFPHGRLPQHWQTMATTWKLVKPSKPFPASMLSTALNTRDVTCRMTKAISLTQTSHVVPQTEVEWFVRENMSQYNVNGSSKVNDERNAMLLRAELHIGFDQKVFVFVPKPDDTGSMHLVAHVLQDYGDIEHAYHNCPLHPTGVDINMFYARFAWSIFGTIDTFLIGSERRRLKLRNSLSDLLDEKGYVSGADCESFATSAIKKSKSGARKRKHNDEGMISDDTSDDEDDYDEMTDIGGIGEEAVDVPNDGEEAVDTPNNGEEPQSSPPELSYSDSTPSSSEETPSPPKSKPQPAPLSPEATFEAMKKSHIAAERKLSDPDGAWEEDLEWLEEVFNGKPLFPSDAARYIHAMGWENLDDR
jgi:hypothetical protein